jgi:hypothetical protein
MAFPTSPTDGQVAVQNGITYTYASATSSWTRVPATLPTLSIYTDTFIGDDVTSSFTLSVTPLSKDYVSINIDGVSQLKSAYILSNNIITFTGVPDINAVIEVKSWSGASIGILTGLTYDSFTGDGTTTAYTLSTSPTNKNYTMVSIGGLTQNKNNYGVSGSTLTFTTAPPNTAPIEVVTFGPAINSAAAQGSNTQVQYNNQGSLAGTSLLTIDTGNSIVNTGNIIVTGNITAGNITASGLQTVGNLTTTGNIISGNANLGNLAIANYFAGVVTTASQPNITSVGSLTGLNVAGTLTYSAVVESLVYKTGATGTVVHDVSQAATFYHSGMTSNFVASFSNVSITDARITTVSLILSQGATAYVPNANVIINTNSQTIKWYGNSTPSGTANGTDVITFTFIKANNNFTAFGQYSSFA